ncbi:phage replisome organizer N-terminal domain-containing protein [Clostridium sp. YIM B02505]|uniref:Phage replisome organizer N-terminal domain-containing protein n=1 Tax=Clostridium yunnanense TaxID=2800325 RepID=A0ABS1ELZ9_9CLOT|nr:phage replisome organizer N-terminal domain-containing protein [Clostridium yunnanense]MBK1810390.1 phage replisome organizer N-terminal domain-containing protein [Clostridium yunnanense]
MRERKYVKFRVDMYEDTKFKIIDMKPERDVIHYIWNRLVLLAGKVNLEGDMFLSKNIPYTIETLAIEFNRDASQIKLALDVFIELEMIEVTSEKIFVVKNFAKHQNIKVKKKEVSKNEAIEVKNSTSFLNEQTANITSKSNIENDKNANGQIIKISNKDLDTVNGSRNDNTGSGTLLEYNSKTLKNKKMAGGNKRRKKGNSKEDNVDEIVSYDGVADDVEECVSDGVRPLGRGEISINEWSFG